MGGRLTITDKNKPPAEVLPWNQMASTFAQGTGQRARERPLPNARPKRAALARDARTHGGARTRAPAAGWVVLALVLFACIPSPNASATSFANWTCNSAGAVTVAANANAPTYVDANTYTINAGVTVTVTSANMGLVICAATSIDIEGTLTALGSGATGGPGTTSSPANAGRDAYGFGGLGDLASPTPPVGGAQAPLANFWNAHQDIAFANFPSVWNGSGGGGTFTSTSVSPHSGASGGGGASTGGAGGVRGTTLASGGVGQAGGSGGGVIILIAPTVIIGGTVTVNGSAGLNSNGFNAGGTGGGAAGSIVIYADTITGASNLYATGGAGGAGNLVSGGAGGTAGNAGSAGANAVTGGGAGGGGSGGLILVNGKTWIAPLSYTNSLVNATTTGASLVYTNSLVNSTTAPLSTYTELQYTNGLVNSSVGACLACTVSADFSYTNDLVNRTTSANANWTAFLVNATVVGRTGYTNDLVNASTSQILAGQSANANWTAYLVNGTVLATSTYTNGLVNASDTDSNTIAALVYTNSLVNGTTSYTNSLVNETDPDAELVYTNSLINASAPCASCLTYTNGLVNQTTSANANWSAFLVNDTVSARTTYTNDLVNVTEANETGGGGSNSTENLTVGNFTVTGSVDGTIGIDLTTQLFAGLTIADALVILGWLFAFLWSANREYYVCAAFAWVGIVAPLFVSGFGTPFRAILIIWLTFLIMYVVLDWRDARRARGTARENRRGSS